MRQQFSNEELTALRNKIPVRYLIEEILEIPIKEIEGVFRFLCPKCREFQTAVNPKTNLSRCFWCEENFNTIELVMKDRELNFVQSVKFLRQLAGRYVPPIAAIPLDKKPLATSILDIS